MMRHIAVVVAVLLTVLANGAPRPPIYADDKVVSDKTFDFFYPYIVSIENFSAKNRKER